MKPRFRDITALVERGEETEQDTAQDFHHMVRFGKESLAWLSNSWPGIPYPYEKSVVFQGYAGMEYPMMANGFAATAPMMLVGADGAPTASNTAYLPNESYGERNTPYPSSEVRRKSW